MQFKSVFYGGPQVSRQNLLSHGKTYVFTAKHTFSLQNLLFHGKTYLLMAKLTFSRQLVSKLGKSKWNDDDMANEEEKIDHVIRTYFFKGFTYREICMFLERHHEYFVSMTTLKRKVKKLGLHRRMRCFDIDAIRGTITELLDGPNNNLGYCTVWHYLQMNGTRVPRTIVADLLKELDPSRVQERRAHRLRRRVYHNSGPNAARHCDGYDKLKPYGFPIHGCIDGWSRKILWLFVTRSNNQPHNIGTYYLESVKTYGGCPVDLVTDLGTENGIMAGIHAFVRNNPDRHHYIPSPRNQRIESWWAFFCHTHTSWWNDYFKDLVEKEVDLTKELHSECLWFCYAPLL